MPLEHSGMFIDYLLSETALQRLKDGQPEALSTVFSDNTYQETEVNTIRSEVKLSTAGLFNTTGITQPEPVSLRKQYTFFPEGTQVQYILKNDSPFNLSAYFVVEIDIALAETDSIMPSLSLYDCEENQKKDSSIITGVFDKTPKERYSLQWKQMKYPVLSLFPFTVSAKEQLSRSVSWYAARECFFIGKPI